MTRIQGFTGTIRGVRLEELEHPPPKKFRWADKLIGELAKARPMEQVLRRYALRESTVEKS